LAALGGLSGAKRAIRGLLRQDGINAVLFYGAPGSGKSTLADILAQAWLCVRPSEGQACGECNVCQSHLGKRAVDIQLIDPYGPSRLLKIDCIRPVNPQQDFKGTSLTEFFRTRPLMARHKIVVLESVERLNQAAGNALLKEIEELAPHCKIILTTAEYGKVMPTIRSRCLGIMCESEVTLAAAEQDEDLARFATTPGQFSRIVASADIFRRLSVLLDKVPDSKPSAALALAQTARQISSDLEEDQGISARAASLRVLEAMGQHLSRRMPDRPEICQKVASGYRLVEQNVNSQMVYEDLFAQMLI